MSSNSVVEIPSVMPTARLKGVAWDLAALFLLFLTPFAKFIAARDYGFFHLEVLIALALLLVIAGLLTALIALRHETLRPTVLCFFVFFFLIQAAQLPVPASWAGALGGEGAVVLRCLFYLLPLMVLAWTLRFQFNKVVAAAFGAMALSAPILPYPPIEALTVVERPEAPTSRRPLIIHLVLDQQIGIDGLDASIPGAANMRRELGEFYQSAGFRVYGSAFTHFPATKESIPDLLNGAVEPSAHRWIEASDGRVGLLRNDWFRRLRAEGYAIEVVQSQYFDYCRDSQAQVTHCASYNPKDIRVIHKIDLSSLDKARYLLLYFLDIDHDWLSRTLRVAWKGLQNLGGLVGIKLPDWNARGVSPSAIASLDAIDLVAARLEQIGPGKALFAHLLLPHHPYVLDESCQVKRDIGQWAERNGSLWWMSVPADPARQQWRHGEYFKQMRCLNRRLLGLFEILERRGLAEEATIIVHGDHGSLITRFDPMNSNAARITPADILSSYSTFFALRSPDIEPGLDGEFASIQGLFARRVMGRADFVDHQDIFLMPSKGVLGPGQLRRPMVRTDTPMP